MTEANELRQRRHAAKEEPEPSPDAALPDLPAPPKLTRRQSCYEAANDRVFSKRRYSMLLGAVLGIVGFAFMNRETLKPPIDNFAQDIAQLPADTMSALKDAFDSFTANNWTARMKEDFFASLDFNPLLPTNVDRPGLELYAQNVKAFSPVVLMPGFTSTGLEIWNGSECSRAYFRQRMWGTARMVQQFMMNQKCWLEHMMLNRTTGLDPDGIKLRAASGLEAADYVIGGYWVWGKIIENFADIGYDTNNMFMAAYDWRLMPILLEERDHYYTKLKYMIEMAMTTNEQRKVVIVAHSYASQIWHYFMKWVESPKGGNGGPSWINDHIDSFVNIAGPMLGTVKSVSCLLSGEMKDTAELGALFKVLELFFGPATRIELTRSWPSAFAMMPLGGQTIWGNSTWAPDDVISRYAIPVEDSEGKLHTVNQTTLPLHLAEHGSNGQLLQFVNQSLTNVTAGEIRSVLAKLDPRVQHFFDLIAMEPSSTPASEKQDDPKYWTNPLAVTLPKAPDMKIYCLYGVGKPVERGYIYRDATELEPEDQKTVPWVLNTDLQSGNYIRSGIRYSDGDGTVPLISLGYMCARGWRSPKYNPGGVQVETREYPHNPAKSIFEARGGPATSDHLDIMGNHDMIRDIMHIITGNHDKVPERILSDINEVAGRVPLQL